MTPRTTILALLPTAGLLALPATGATIVKERRVTETKGEGTKTEVVESVFEGNNARISFLEGADPMMGVGGYMLMRGNSLYFVNPSQRTYMRMDEAEMQAMSEQARQSQRRVDEASGGDGATELKNFEFQPLLDEEGPAMLGYPTRHYKYRLKYKLSKPIPGQMGGMTMDTTVDRTDEFWATTGLTLEGPRGMRLDPSSEDGEDADLPREVLEAEGVMDGKGFKLKSTSDLDEAASMGGAMGMMAKIASAGMGGSTDKVKSRTTTEVLEIREASVPQGTFDLPAGYTETSMMGPGGSMPDLNDVPGGPGRSGMPDLNQVPGPEDPGEGMP
jgi:hypothetical protein